MRAQKIEENVNSKTHKKSRQDKELREILRAQLRFNSYMCIEADHNFPQQHTPPPWEKQNRG